MLLSPFFFSEIAYLLFVISDLVLIKMIKSEMLGRPFLCKPGICLTLLKANMICFILALFASVASFNYKAGEQFSYTYNSHVELNAIDSTVRDSDTYFDFTCTAKFTVLSLMADGIYLEMSLSDISGRVGGPSNHSDWTTDAALDEV